MFHTPYLRIHKLQAFYTGSDAVMTEFRASPQQQQAHPTLVPAARACAVRTLCSPNFTCTTRIYLSWQPFSSIERRWGRAAVTNQRVRTRLSRFSSDVRRYIEQRKCGHTHGVVCVQGGSATESQWEAYNAVYQNLVVATYPKTPVHVIVSTIRAPLLSSPSHRARFVQGTMSG